MTQSEKIFNKLQALAPELAEVEEAKFNVMYEIAVGTISRAYGDNYELAMTLYIAHLLTMQQIVSEEGADYLNVASEKEGDLQRTYGDGGRDGLLAKTYYGQMLLDLRKNCVFSAVTRLG